MSPSLAASNACGLVTYAIINGAALFGDPICTRTVPIRCDFCSPLAHNVRARARPFECLFRDRKWAPLPVGRCRSRRLGAIMIPAAAASHLFSPTATDSRATRIKLFPRREAFGYCFGATLQSVCRAAPLMTALFGPSVARAHPLESGGGGLCGACEPTITTQVAPTLHAPLDSLRSQAADGTVRSRCRCRCRRHSRWRWRWRWRSRRRNGLMERVLSRALESAPLARRRSTQVAMLARSAATSLRGAAQDVLAFRFRFSVFRLR